MTPEARQTALFVVCCAIIGAAAGTAIGALAVLYAQQAP